MIDLDPVACDAARMNCELNGLREPKFAVICGDLVKGVEASADIVIANITADVLLRLAGDIKGRLKNGGKIILSGILNSRLEDVREYYLGCGYKEIDYSTLGEWSSLVFA
jgi:ribosomal protein L11 methyltransferase